MFITQVAGYINLCFEIASQGKILKIIDVKWFAMTSKNYLNSNLNTTIL